MLARVASQVGHEPLVSERRRLELAVTGDPGGAHHPLQQVDERGAARVLGPEHDGAEQQRGRRVGDGRRQPVEPPSHDRGGCGRDGDRQPAQHGRRCRRSRVEQVERRLVVTGLLMPLGGGGAQRHPSVGRHQIGVDPELVGDHRAVVPGVQQRDTAQLGGEVDGTTEQVARKRGAEPADGDQREQEVATLGVEAGEHLLGDERTHVGLPPHRRQGRQRRPPTGGRERAIPRDRLQLVCGEDEVVLVDAGDTALGREAGEGDGRLTATGQHEGGVAGEDVDQLVEHGGAGRAGRDPVDVVDDEAHRRRCGENDGGDHRFEVAARHRQAGGSERHRQAIDKGGGVPVGVVGGEPHVDPPGRQPVLTDRVREQCRLPEPGGPSHDDDPLLPPAREQGQQARSQQAAHRRTGRFGAERPGHRRPATARR